MCGLRAAVRVYLGAVLKSPESVIVLRDVFFEGLQNGYKFKEGCPDTKNTHHDICYVPFPSKYLDQHQNMLDYADFAKGNPDDFSLAHWMTSTALHTYGIVGADGNIPSDIDKPTRIYQGTSRCTTLTVSGLSPISETTILRNAGHMGTCDWPGNTSRLWGSFVYSDTPCP